jgi:hypothetical protein
VLLPPPMRSQPYDIRLIEPFAATAGSVQSVAPDILHSHWRQLLT